MPKRGCEDCCWCALWPVTKTATTFTCHARTHHPPPTCARRVHAVCRWPTSSRGSRRGTRRSARRGRCGGRTTALSSTARSGTASCTSACTWRCVVGGRLGGWERRGERESDQAVAAWRGRLCSSRGRRSAGGASLLRMRGPGPAAAPSSAPHSLPPGLTRCSLTCRLRTVVQYEGEGEGAGSSKTIDFVYDPEASRLFVYLQRAQCARSSAVSAGR